jgi:hypothetical protein
MAGTHRVWRETQTIPAGPLSFSRAPVSRGSRREQEEPIVHPNTIKRLSTGELVLLSGVPEPTVAKVRVDARTPQRGSRAPRRRTGARDAQAREDDARGA